VTFLNHDMTFLNRHVTLHVTPGFGVTPRVTFFNRGVTPT
jgi:hypothetical protein